MKILVLIKEVPDMEKVRFDSETTAMAFLQWLMLKSIPSMRTLWSRPSN